MTNGWIDLRECVPDDTEEKILVWHVYQDALLISSRLYRQNRFYVYWQPIPQDGWTETDKRQPEREDGDTQGCVLAKHRIFGYRVTGWHQVRTVGGYTCWRSLPAPPENHRLLKTLY